jgi:chromosome segregation ATPase
MDRKDYIDKLTIQLKQWDAEIEKMEAKVQEKKADARILYNKKIEELQNKKEEAQNKIEEIKNASDEAWEELKSGAERAFDNIKNSFHSVISKFK